jgi:RimJ/RimL family protein N-acetyltransferase
MDVHAPRPCTLRGERVLLRPLAAGDTAALWDSCGDPEAFRWVWPYAMAQPSDMEAFVERAVADGEAGVRVPFAQVDLLTGAVVGSTSYLDVDVASAHVEIGWTVLSPRVWRTGFNVEAKLLLLGHAFDALGMERVALKTDHLNERSQAAIAALGATREGTLRHHVRRTDGSWRDSVYFSVLREEWPAVRSRLEARLRRG